MGSVKLLDCTLRDGGFLNDWNFGYDHILNIFDRLVQANIDVIEIGFINSNRPYDLDRSILPDGKSINQSFCKLAKGKSMVVGMIDFGTCGIENLQPAEESYLDGIRVIFKKEDGIEALRFCGDIKRLGYKVFVQAVSVTSYSDKEYAEFVMKVNELEPYAFSVVDTYGLLHSEELNRYFSLADKLLKSSICLGYHSHNNFQLAYSNCISLMENPPERTLLIDGTLYGMGKGAGNAPLELLAMYLNNYHKTAYDLESILEIISSSILPLYGSSNWGYSLIHFISALQKCHPSYTTFLMEKRTLSIASIYEILGEIALDSKLRFDRLHIEELYKQHQANSCNDEQDLFELSCLLQDQKVLLIGSGTSIQKHADDIHSLIETENPIIISVNFMPEEFKPNYLFISNSRRYVEVMSKLKVIDFNLELIGTSNVSPKADAFDFILRYEPLIDKEADIYDNPLIMLLKLLNQLGAAQIYLAGFDGYSLSEEPDYVNPKMAYSFTKQKAAQINTDTQKSIQRLIMSVPIDFVTESQYQIHNVCTDIFKLKEV